MPQEMTSIKVVQPEGVAVLTGEDLQYSTVASLCAPANRSVAIITVPPGKLSDKDREWLQDFARVVIFGNHTVVSMDAEKALDGVEIKRIQGAGLFEECWLFTAEMWQDGISEVVLSSPKPVDIFRAYQVAKNGSLPLIICEGNVTEATRYAIKDLTKRNVTLSKALIVGDILEANSRALQDAGVLMEKVRA